MANAVKVKGSNTINDNDVSNGEIDNFIESFAVQRENSLNYHSSPLVTNNCSGEVVQFDGDIYEVCDSTCQKVSENHRDIIPNDESELIITLNSTRGKKRKRTTKSFGKFCGNSLTIGGRISSTINFQMALELFKKFQIDSNLKNHIESNVNQTITIFENYSNNFTGENCGNKNSQHFNLVEWLNNDPSNQIKYPLLFNYGGIEFGGGYINNDKFLESRSIVSFGSNFDKK
uniref:TLDc domain-containing protein n=1 Tax=Meloidogyne hapla TaxID=6305 RepID=A0A1I8B0J5_MELHA